jgi:hypothetical protein
MKTGTFELPLRSGGSGSTPDDQQSHIVLLRSVSGKCADGTEDEDFRLRQRGNGCRLMWFWQRSCQNHINIFMVSFA